MITRGATIEQTKTILTTTKTVLAKTNSNKKYFNKNYTNKNYFKKKKPVKRNLLQKTYDSLPLEKTSTSYNVIIFIKSVFNKDKKATIMYFLKNVHISYINMLYYNETDVSEGIDINKTSLSKEYDNCLYEYGNCQDEGFRLRPYVCKNCHEP